MTTPLSLFLNVLRHFAPLVSFIVVLPCIGFAQQAGAGPATGDIEGTVTSVENYGIGGVIVTLEPLRRVETSDQQGAFAFRGVPPGTYVVRMRVAALDAEEADVTVVAGRTTRIAKVLERDFRFQMTAIVSAVSRVQELQIEAPAAIGVVDERTIALEGGAGQLPTLLQSIPGSEVAQSGLYDIQFNARGFNATLSRRVQVLLDGRDIAAPENRNQEWITFGFLAPELENIEFVRGPAGALYGANSVNGVVAMTTKSPRGHPGGRATFTTGELGTVMGDVRWSGSLGRDWYTKLQVNRTSSGSFAKSRTQTTEYPGLALEIAPATPDVDATAVDARFDKYFGAGRQLVLESGFSKSEGGVYLSQGGRFSVLDSKRSWNRVNVNSTHWTAQAYINTRHGEIRTLEAGVTFPTQTVQVRGEVQGNRRFDHARGRAVYGGSFLAEHVSSADSAGVQRLFQKAVTTKAPALFGQIDYDLSSRIKAIAAVRWDESTLHDRQVSPKGALIFRLSPQHTLRAGFGRGFQVGNYNELYVNLPLAAPLDLSSLEAAFAPLLGGVKLGFDSVPVLALGNNNLDVEKVRSWEAGYVGTIGSRARISLDVYRNSMRDFITDVLPGVNPSYPAYRAPVQLPDDVRTLIEQTVNPLLPGLTNGPTGEPQIVYSLGNVGLVTTRGVETGAAVRLPRGFSVEGTYTFFDFTIERSQLGADPKPNAPKHRVTWGVTYERPRFSASFRFRWVDSHPWISGLMNGPVPSYNVSDLNAAYSINERWQIGLNVANIFDQSHYEMFGGDLLRRRALMSLSFRW